MNDKVTTRAANDAGANYKVYAAWSGGTAWFINDELNGTTNVPQNGPYYWPSTGTVDFYAYAPATITATGTYPALSIAYTVPANAAQDFTIAAPKTGLSSSSGTVAFEFAHMLSKISVKATLHQDLIDAGYVLSTTGLTASLDVQSTGGTIVPTTTPFAWTSPNATAATYTGAASYMIMPQSSIGCAVQVTGGIEITKNNVEIYSGDLSKYTISGGNVTGDNFVMGKHYMLNLTISEISTGGGGEDIFNIITFSANVAPWDTETGTDIPLVQP
ncbi:fimbrillin family protein [uncultured Proteiniphilum sp.]|uniref:fimbrillin family protein n=1 Tax=uncultured Proteiniphilum sp. TaxID=497637 RepID=UPI00261C228D|nr:fimbrillin family protein [uncultured Proteiniphilum sp.]